MYTEVIQTSEGSSSLYIPGLKEQYHSRHGAVQESEHVYIQAGMGECPMKEMAIFEMGFGTGLNALLTFLRARKEGRFVHYDCIENSPLPFIQVDSLGYPEFLKLDKHEAKIFRTMHECKWDRVKKITHEFTLLKKEGSLENISFVHSYDLVYFDAFAPEVQPELWTEGIFRKLYHAINVNGILVTYCAKGEVRRCLQRSGFLVERLSGPPGKREMLRARKNA
jgi:tRNA U34 5-methylaminomethyl-2-thiouridine-forming methyltransferase MnmC